jgi:hypothetical protein
MDKKQLERKNNIIALISLLADLEGKSKAESKQLTLLFNLHNYFYPRNMEHSKHCAPCRERVYKRCKLIKEELQIELNNYPDEQ